MESLPSYRRRRDCRFLVERAHSCHARNQSGQGVRTDRRGDTPGTAVDRIVQGMKDWSSAEGEVAGPQRCRRRVALICSVVP